MKQARADTGYRFPDSGGWRLRVREYCGWRRATTGLGRRRKPAVDQLEPRAPVDVNCRWERGCKSQRWIA